MTAEHNRTEEARAMERIVNATRRLEAFPNSCPSGKVEGTRDLVVPGFPYVIVYRVVSDRVEILRVFHTAQDWPRQMH